MLTAKTSRNRDQIRNRIRAELELVGHLVHIAGELAADSNRSDREHGIRREPRGALKALEDHIDLADFEWPLATILMESVQDLKELEDAELRESSEARAEGRLAGFRAALAILRRDDLAARLAGRAVNDLDDRQLLEVAADLDNEKLLDLIDELRRMQ